MYFSTPNASSDTCSSVTAIIGITGERTGRPTGLPAASNPSHRTGASGCNSTPQIHAANSVLATPFLSSTPARSNRRRPANRCPRGYSSYRRYTSARFSSSRRAACPDSEPGPNTIRSSMKSHTCGPNVGNAKSTAGTCKTAIRPSGHKLQTRIVTRLRRAHRHSLRLPPLRPLSLRILGRLNLPLQTATSQRIRPIISVGLLQPNLSLRTRLRVIGSPKIVVQHRHTEQPVDIRVCVLRGHRRRPNVIPPTHRQRMPRNTIRQVRRHHIMIRRQRSPRRRLIATSTHRRIFRYRWHSPALVDSRNGRKSCHLYLKILLCVLVAISLRRGLRCLRIMMWWRLTCRMVLRGIR
ncbi:hypothetical protein Henu3_gp58 [Mycobacterium phage Henu3 PeY-2017]|nr:hypothetical protein Henu3_gp58 [Mycobacterium phage Henu3 PeY-2017]